MTVAAGDREGWGAEGPCSLTAACSCRAGFFGTVVEYGAERKISRHSVLGAVVSVGVPQGVSLKVKYVEFSSFWPLIGFLGSPCVKEETLLGNSVRKDTVALSWARVQLPDIQSVLSESVLQGLT